MPTTFNVIALGQQAEIDTRENNTTAEKAHKLVGLEFGSGSDPLSKHVKEFSPGSTGYNSATSGVYDMAYNRDTFRIDGGDNQTFDGTSVYNATLTYLDGTTAQITAVIFQDTHGNTYLAPEYSYNADQRALEAKSIASLKLDSLLGNRWTGMYASRETSEFSMCFCAGTLIATTGGPRPVERLEPGEQILTRDRGAQALRWVKSRHMRTTDALAPIRIAAGALGEGLPRRALRVSPQHRMLLRSNVAERIWGSQEVLIAAKKLLPLPGVRQEPGGRDVAYYHLLFDRHEVVFAEGAPSESLFLGPQTLQSLSSEQIEEIEAIFPDLVPPCPARPVAERKAAKDLVQRHRKHAKPVLSG
ncbi:MAG: Hint domain-containing protein [Pseudomonadota bacterium]